MLYSIVAIGMGGAIGAWLRWGIGLWLNPMHNALSLGTLAANMGWWLWGRYCSGMVCTISKYQ